MNSSAQNGRFPRSVAVVGGAGFLGSHVVKLLHRRHPGTQLSVADLKTARPPWLDPSIEWFGGADVLKPETLLPAFEGADAVVHVASFTSFWESDRSRLYEVNKEGTRNVLLTCAWARATRLVYVSTASTIGFTNDPEKPADETLSFDWSRVSNKHFMSSKYAGELQLKDAERLNVSTVIANPSTMLGPGDSRTSNKLFQAIQRGEVRAVPPGGRNVVDVRDVADGICRMLWPNIGNEKFILGGYNLTFREINDTIASVLGVDPPKRIIPSAMRVPLFALTRLAEKLPNRPTRIAADDLEAGFEFRYYSSAKAREKLGWVPRHTFEQTVRDSAEDLLSRRLLSPYQ